jgi:hypothetical protein
MTSVVTKERWGAALPALAAYRCSVHPDSQDTIHDLIADLFHMARHEGLDVAEVRDSAFRMFMVEDKEQEPRAKLTLSA